MPDHDPTRSAPGPGVTGPGPDPAATVRGPGTPTLAAPAPPASAGRYELGVEIARGGMGAVYRATDTVFAREVAVKVLLDKFDPTSGVARRFYDEARITGQLQHPNIPAVFDLDTLPDGRPFLAMKLIGGDTLADRLKARPDPAADRGRFVAVFEQVCEAVAYAHAHGVIHRDLKPSNVMVGAFSEVQVMDWGLAKVLAEPERPKPDAEPRPGEADGGDPDRTTAHRPSGGSTDDRTRFGQALGTPAYMPPEQARGELDRIDARADVFALGGILCAVLTGKPPYDGTSGREVMARAAAADLAAAAARLDASGAEPDLVALCKRCLAPDPADRPADAAAVAAAVAAYQAGIAERTRRAEVQLHRREVQALEERKRRRVLYWSAGVAVGLLLAGVVGTAVGLVRATEAADAERRANQTAQAKKVEADEAKERAQAEQRTAEREKQNALKRLKQIEKGVESFAAMITDLDPSRERAGGDPVYVQLRRKAEKLATELDGEAVGDPLAVARLQSLLGRAIKELGNPEVATPVLEKAYATRLRELGAEHDDTLETARELAGTYYSVGKYSESLELRKTGHAIRVAKLGPENSLSIAELSGIANVYSAQHKYTEALELYNQVRAISLKLSGGVENNETLTALFNLASSSQKAGKRDVAIGFFEQALAGEIKIRGVNSVETAIVRHRLGSAYWHAGRFREAVEQLEPAREVYERVYGVESDKCHDVLYRLARAYWDNGQLPVSIQVFEQLKAVQTKKLGPDSHETLDTLGFLANAYRTAGRWPEAQSHCEQLMSGVLRNPTPPASERGSQKPIYSVSYQSLRWYSASVEWFADAGKAELAEGWQRKWVECVRARYRGLDSLHFAHELSTLGLVVLRQRKWAAAEPPLRECLAIHEKLAPDTWERYHIQSQLGQALLGQKKYAEAESLLLASREGLVAHADKATASQRRRAEDLTALLFQLYDESGDKEKAAAWRKELDKTVAAQANDPDRKAAVWVVSQRGHVKTNSEQPATDQAAGLPTTPFRLTAVGLTGKPIADADLERLKACTELAELTLDGTPVTDAGLAHLADLARLRVFSARDTKLTGTGLTHLKAAKELHWLMLINTPLTDEGMKSVAEFKKLSYLNLYATKVTDAGLVHLRGLNDLTDLTLGATAVTDAGLKSLAGLKGLRKLWLHQNAVTDAGLEHLKECPALSDLTLLAVPITDKGLIALREVKSLTRLNVGWTRVTDAGLVNLPQGLTQLILDNDAITDEGLTHLKRLKGLKELVLTRTKVTAKGVEALHASVPGCKIVYSAADGKDAVLEAKAVDGAPKGP
jgi:serine/threonine protein kinase